MMQRIRLLVAYGLLAAGAFAPAVAQNAPPTAPSGRTAPAGTAVAPPRSAADDGGQRPPTDPTGQTAPRGTPVAPSRLADPATATEGELGLMMAGVTDRKAAE